MFKIIWIYNIKINIIIIYFTNKIFFKAGNIFYITIILVLPLVRMGQMYADGVQ